MSTEPTAPISAGELVVWRHEAKMTQTQLAEAVGVTQRHVSRWETGDMPIPPLACIRIRYMLSMIERPEAERALGRLLLGDL